MAHKSYFTSLAEQWMRRHDPVACILLFAHYEPLTVDLCERCAAKAKRLRDIESLRQNQQDRYVEQIKKQLRQT